MSIHKPFDPDRPLFSSRCSCGLHASESEHHAAQLRKADVEEDSANFIEASLVKAVFPHVCVTRLIRSQEVMPHSLVFKTTGFMEQPFSTSLHQKVFN